MNNAETPYSFQELKDILDTYVEIELSNKPESIFIPELVTLVLTEELTTVKKIEAIYNDSDARIVSGWRRQETFEYKIFFIGFMLTSYAIDVARQLALDSIEIEVSQIVS